MIKLKLYISCILCDLFCFLYFLSIHQKTEIGIYILFILSMISFCSAGIFISEHMNMKKRDALGKYFSIRIIHFFVNSYLINELSIFYVTYMLIIFFIFEMYMIHYLNYQEKVKLNYDIDNVRENWWDLDSVVLITFSSILDMSIIRYIIVFLAIAKQIKTWKLKNKMKYIIITIEIIYLFIDVMYKIDFGLLAFVLIAVLYGFQSKQNRSKDMQESKLKTLDKEVELSKFKE